MDYCTEDAENRKTKLRFLNWLSKCPGLSEEGIPAKLPKSSLGKSSFGEKSNKIIHSDFMLGSWLEICMIF